MDWNPATLNVSKPTCVNNLTLIRLRPNTLHEQRYTSLGIPHTSQLKLFKVHRSPKPRYAQVRMTDTYYKVLLAQNPETQAILQYPNFGYPHLMRVDGKWVLLDVQETSMANAKNYTEAQTIVYLVKNRAYRAFSC